MFGGCKNIIDFSPITNLDLNNVKYMNYMFGNTNIDNLAFFRDIKLSNNLISLQSTFSSCEYLTNLNGLENLDVSNVFSMGYTFYSKYGKSYDIINGIRLLSNLTDISALSNWNTSNLRDMDHTFYNCTALTDLSALSNWNTDGVAGYYNTFAETGRIDTSGLSNWNFVNKYANYMFANSLLNSVNGLIFDNCHMTNTFYSCTSIVNVSNTNFLNFNQRISQASMFAYCSLLRVFSNVTFINYAPYGANIFLNAGRLNYTPTKDVPFSFFNVNAYNTGLNSSSGKLFAVSWGSLYMDNCNFNDCNLTNFVSITGMGGYCNFDNCNFTNTIMDKSFQCTNFYNFEIH